MSEIARISEQDIQDWVGSKSFERGYKYFEEGAVFETQRQGARLKALCEGSQPHPYQVEATLNAKGIHDALCSCPVGDDGRCKHVAALLLMWFHSSDEFSEVDTIDQILTEKTKEELIVLIEKMLDRYPELEMGLRVSSSINRQRRMPASSATYRKQADSILRYGADEYGWQASFHAAAELDQIIAVGEEFVARQEWASAAAVYQGVSASIFNNYGEYHDAEGELISIVEECVAGLGLCLAATDPETREMVWRAMFEIYQKDID